MVRLIKINTKSHIIPVEIGDLKFQVEATDENLIQYRNALLGIKEELENVQDEDMESMQIVKDAILKAFDVILGNGAGRKIYEKVGSTIICIDILYQLKNGIEKEFGERGMSFAQQDKAQQYLQEKKRRNKR